MTDDALFSTPPSPVVLEARGLTKHFTTRRRGRDVLRGGKRVVHAVDDVTFALRRGTGDRAGR